MIEPAPATREIRLHDTRSGELLPLRPRDRGKVGIYACGPTVYSRIHIGNARPFVVFSLVKRFLEHEGLQTTLVVNVTDVNDKIYDAARARDRPSGELAREMTERYFADTGALGLGRPDREPLASETIGSIVAYIQTLIDTGHAYAAEGDVFFRVRSDSGYGSLSHRRVEEIDLEPHPSEDKAESARKEDPLDFALWKGHKEGEDTWWDTPWGQGRPGWHIECSAMAEDALGVGFDIHGGGSDLLFPHHENEAAQTRAARGAGAGADLDAQRHDPNDRREDGEVGRQHRAAARGDRAVRGGGGGRVSDLGPLPSAARVLPGGARAGAGQREPHRRYGPAPGWGRLAARHAADRRSVL